MLLNIEKDTTMVYASTMKTGRAHYGVEFMRKVWKKTVLPEN